MRVEIEAVGVQTMMAWHQTTLRRVEITFFLIVAEIKTKGQAKKGSIMSTGYEQWQSPWSSWFTVWSAHTEPLT